MGLNTYLKVNGYITQERYIKGKSLPQLESLLGFQRDRLKSGVIIAALEQIPAKNQFELAGYSQVAAHHFGPNATRGMDVNKLKELLIREVFTLTGEKRLMKVIPLATHDKTLSDDLQYPPGQGVPQWKLISPLSARTITVVKPGRIYM